MTREQRIDAQIEETLQRWKARLLGNYWNQHNRQQPIFEQRQFGTLPAGTWLYVCKPGGSAGYVLGCIQDDRRIQCGKAKYQMPPSPQALAWIRVGFRDTAQCECSPCTVYRTCFLEASA